MVGFRLKIRDALTCRLLSWSALFCATHPFQESYSSACQNKFTLFNTFKVSNHFIQVTFRRIYYKLSCFITATVLLPLVLAFLLPLRSLCTSEALRSDFNLSFLLEKQKRQI